MFTVKGRACVIVVASDVRADWGICELKQQSRRDMGADGFAFVEWRFKFAPTDTRSDQKSGCQKSRLQAC
jgi:hypothetical protein